jgi:glycosyltransferase involved in cell wall biosynthesis
MRYLLRHPKSIFYVQKTGYHFLSVLGAAVFNHNRIILDLDDHDFHHNSWPQLDKYLPSFRTPEAHVAMLEAASAVVVASHEIQKTVEERGVSPFFLPTVPDLQRFTASPDLKSVLPKTDKVRIWWGGDVFGHVFDNVVLAFEHIASMPQQARDRIELVLCGFGDYYYLLAKYLKERFGDAFQLTELGAIPADDIPALLNEIDIGFIMFNKWSNFDTYKSPTKMFELMAMGKAIIAERCGEPVHIIDDGIDGFLAEGRDEWAAKLALLIDSAAMRKAMGRRARRKIETQYSLQVTMPILRDIIELVRSSPEGRVYAPKSFSNVPHRNAVSKITPTLSMERPHSSAGNGMDHTPRQPAPAPPPGFKVRTKSWVRENLPPQTVNTLRAINKVLRI